MRVLAHYCGLLGSADVLHFNVGITSCHNGPDSVFTVGIDCKDVAVGRVGGIEVSVAHEALLFVARVLCVFIGSENAVVCDAPLCAVLCNGFLGVFVIERIFNEVGCVLAVVFITGNNLLEVCALVGGCFVIVLTGFTYCFFGRSFNNPESYCA